MNWLSWLRPKKSRITADSAFGLTSFCGVSFSTVGIEQRHALLDQPLRAGQAHAALVLEQLAHRADAAAAEMVDVVDRPFALA